MPVKWCFHKEKNLTILTVLCNLLLLLPKILSIFYTNTVTNSHHPGCWKHHSPLWWARPDHWVWLVRTDGCLKGHWGAHWGAEEITHQWETGRYCCHDCCHPAIIMCVIRRVQDSFMQIMWQELQTSQNSVHVAKHWPEADSPPCGWGWRGCCFHPASHTTSCPSAHAHWAAQTMKA